MAGSSSFNKDTSILITGGTGLVGKALSKQLASQGYTNVISIGSRDCDLRDSTAVSLLMENVSPKHVFHLAARVHGIGGNTLYKSDILYENVMINSNVVEMARRAGVDKIVAMGSGCVYPELKGHEELFENQIWTGPPHSSEDSYAHSKRLMMAQLDAAKEQYGLSSAFVISGNLYGPDDNFNIDEGHVTPSLVAKFFDAYCNNKPVSVWGSGVAIRDFTYSSDVAKALLAIWRNIEGPINMGSGMRHPIRDIIDILQSITGVEVEWDSNKPDGQLVRFYNLNKLNETGFKAKIDLEEGVKLTYDWYVNNWKNARN